MSYRRSDSVCITVCPLLPPFIADHNIVVKFCWIVVKFPTKFDHYLWPPALTAMLETCVRPPRLTTMFDHHV